MNTAASNSGANDTVRLVVPAALEYVRLVRLTSSGVASRLGFDIEEIEDLRVAVDELVSVVIEAADQSGALELRFEVQDGFLRIEGSAPIGPDASGQTLVDDLSSQILAAVVDKWDMDTSNGAVRFACERRIPEID